MQVQKVISVGGNPELLWLRNAVLKYEGFDVMTSLRQEDALEAILRGDCGTLLMCYSMDRTARQVLAQAFRQIAPAAVLLRSRTSKRKRRNLQTRLFMASKVLRRSLKLFGSARLPWAPDGEG